MSRGRSAFPSPIPWILSRRYTDVRIGTLIPVYLEEAS